MAALSTDPFMDKVSSIRIVSCKGRLTHEMTKGLVAWKQCVKGGPEDLVTGRWEVGWPQWLLQQDMGTQHICEKHMH